MKTPILVTDTDGEIGTFFEVEGPKGFITPIGQIEPNQVQDGMYTAYDSEGRLLHISIVKRPIAKKRLFIRYVDQVEHVAVRPAEPQPTHAEELKRKLAAYLSGRLGEEEDTLMNLPLDELVGRTITYHGHMG